MEPSVVAMGLARLIAATLACGVALVACSPGPSPTGQAKSGQGGGQVASGGPSVSPTRVPPGPSPAATCVPSADTRALAGPVAAYFWGHRGAGCATVSLMNGSGQLSTVTTKLNHASQFVCRDGKQAQPSPSAGLTPGPAYSVTKNRIYWWDGHLVRWLDRNGTQGSEVLDAGPKAGLEFSVSPDDARTIITAIDFGKWPLHRTTWIEDVGTRANKVVIVNTTLSNPAAVGSTGWPWGWQNGRPVLFDFPLCVTLGGDQWIGLSYPRVVDPTIGVTLVKFPKCYGGAITPGGIFCTASFVARALEMYDWTGKRVKSWALSRDTVACDGDPSPSGSRVLAYCEYNIYTQRLSGPTTQQFLFGPGPALPKTLAQAQPLRWLDNDLMLETQTQNDGTNQSAVYVWSLSRQAVVAGPIAIPGWYNVPRQWFNAEPPPTRLLA